MTEELYNILTKELLEKDNKKIKEENLESYLSGFLNHQLTRLAITHVFVDIDYRDLIKIKNLNNRPKKYIIDYITNNLEKVLSCYIKIIDENTLDNLKEIIKRQEKNIYDISDLNINFSLIIFFKEFAFAKLEYNKKTKTLKAYMPKEFVKILSRAIKNKKLLKENSYNNQVFNAAKNIVDVYGVIPFTKLHEIYNSQIENIDVDDLRHIIESRTLVDEGLCIYSDYETETIVCNLEFEDFDEAFDFYKNQKGNYKEYSKKEMEDIATGKYLESLKPYKEFMNYLNKMFELTEEDVEEIRDMIVLDFINFAQISLDDAVLNFKHNMSEMFEISNSEVNNLLKIMKQIYKEYPKWIKKGNI